MEEAYQEEIDSSQFESNGAEYYPQLKAELDSIDSSFTAARSLLESGNLPYIQSMTTTYESILSCLYSSAIIFNPQPREIVYIIRLVHLLSTKCVFNRKIQLKFIKPTNLSLYPCHVFG